MNRGAVIGFLVLAACVGATASLRQQDFAAIGERLLAAQSAIDAATTYQSLPRLQTANARLAFLDYQSSGDFDVPSDYNYYQAQAWDDPYNYDPGSFIEPQWTTNYDLPNDYFSTPSSIEPQWSSNYDLPSDTSYYQTPGWDDPYNYDPGTSLPTQEVEVRNAYYDGGYGGPLDFSEWQNVQISNPGDPDNIGFEMAPGSAYPTNSASWGDPDNYGTLVAPSGTAYPRVHLPSRESNNPRNAAGVRTYAPSIYEVTTYAPNIYEVTSYAPHVYSIGGGGGYSPQPTWYEQAFPGWGSAVVPLLPSQYRPGYGNDCYGASGPTIGGALSVSDNGFGISLGLGLGNNNYPCYGGYNPYLSVAPTYYDSANGYGNARVPPTCSISLADSSIEYGKSAVISWSAQNATGATLNGVGSIPASGTRTLSNQTASRTIGITVTGPGGTGACYAALSVNTTQPPTCQISANPSTIKKGETANLAWVSTNATEAALSGLGTVPVQSGRVVSPSADATFTLRVKNAADLTATCSVKVDVQ